MSLNMLESSVNAAAEQGEESQVSECSLNSLLWLTSAVAQSIDNATSHPDPAPSCCQPRMRETSRGEEEEELRKILQSVLVRSLDAVEDLAVLAVHVRVLHTILLPCHPNSDTFPHDHEDCSNASRDHISIFSRQRHCYHPDDIQRLFEWF